MSSCFAESRWSTALLATRLDRTEHFLRIGGTNKTTRFYNRNLSSMRLENRGVPWHEPSPSSERWSSGPTGEKGPGRYSHSRSASATGGDARLVHRGVEILERPRPSSAKSTGIPLSLLLASRVYTAQPPLPTASRSSYLDPSPPLRLCPS